MNRIMIASFALLAAACTLSEDQFAEEYIEVFCEVSTQCWETTADQGDCEDAATTSEPREICDDYDASAASDCIEAIHDYADNCPSADPLEYQTPQVCGSVCGDSTVDPDSDSDSN